MGLELHVWGPAFTLPSIDPECMATVAYFAHAVPRGRWMLTASAGEGWSDPRQLPALHDGSKVVCGFQSIVAYLKNTSNGQWDLDAALTPLQRADCIAFSTFLSAKALPLLDLSLYVSSQNYAAATRPAYAFLLNFPASWVIPTKRRAAAKLRSAHLGLSALDLSDSSQAERDGEPSAAASISIPESLRKAKASVSAAIKTPETASRIRLEVLTENVLDPLVALLSHSSGTDTAEEESYFLSPQRPSSLDCLALGYLALFLVPSVPHPFLATVLKEKYPTLTRYVRRGIKSCYGGAVKLEDARPGIDPAQINHENEDEDIDLSTSNNMDIGSGDVELPWRDAPPASPLQNVGALLREAVDGIPGLGSLLKPDPVRHSSSSTADPATNTVSPPPPPLSLLSALLAVGAGAVAVGGAVLYTGGFGTGVGERRAYGGSTARKTRLADMGEAGGVLAMGSFGGLNPREKRI